MARIIKICGQDLTLKYSMHAATAYEKMTGRNALDLAQFQPDEENPNIIPVAPLSELGYCMLLGANDLQKLGIDLETMLNDLDTKEKMFNFLHEVSQELLAFYQPDKTADPEKQEDAAKNA